MTGAGVCCPSSDLHGGALTNLLKHGAGAEVRKFGTCIGSKEPELIELQGSNNSAVVSTILEIVNVTMRGRLLTAHKHSSLANCSWSPYRRSCQ